jgi:hypothetical protein
MLFTLLIDCIIGKAHRYGGGFYQEKWHSRKIADTSKMELSSTTIKKGGPGVRSISVYWALLAGLFSAVAQVITYYARFGRWNAEASFTEYLLFFIAGSLGGLVLIFFLNRQTSTRGRWILIAAFLLASPIALLLMLGGGLLGPLGILIFPQVPWALFTWIGSLLGRLVSRPRKKKG